MKKFLATATAVAALITVAASAAPASAETTGSLGWSRTDTGDANLDAITGRLGWRSGWFGVEGELSGGVGNDTVTVGGTSVDVKLRDQAAIYATGTVPINPNFDLFARVGYGGAKVQRRPSASAALSRAGTTGPAPNTSSTARTACARNTPVKTTTRTWATPMSGRCPTFAGSDARGRGAQRLCAPRPPSGPLPSTRLRRCVAIRLQRFLTSMSKIAARIGGDCVAELPAKRAEPTKEH